MHDHPNISIIIPIYNSSQYLDECIEGIINQDYTDFEAILIDDGSNDDSYEICCKWAKRDERLLVTKQNNAGASAARNRGLELARGNWIIFVDSDDKVLPQYVSNLYEIANRDKCIVLAVSGVLVHRNGLLHEKRGFPNLTCNISDYKKIFGDIRLHKYGYSVGKLYNRGIIEKFNIRFDPQICIAEDCMFMLNYLMDCYNIPKAKISFINQNDYQYNIHTNSLSTGNASMEREFYSYKMYRRTIYDVKNNWNIDSVTFEYLHSPIVFYADRVLNTIYKEINSSSSRISLLKQIDRQEYKKYKKENSVFERILVFLFSKRLYRLYDIIRKCSIKRA